MSKGEVFSVSPSPLSNDMILIFPVDFLIIVLITTELDTYSMISTIMCDLDFSNSAVFGFTLAAVWSALSMSSFEFIPGIDKMSEGGQTNPQICVFFCSWTLHNPGYGLYYSHFGDREW